MYVRSNDTAIEKGWKALADAIIVQAAKDYKKALKHNARSFCREIESFFHSEWFMMLTDTNPDKILNRVRQEVKSDERKRILESVYNERQGDKQETPAS